MSGGRSPFFERDDAHQWIKTLLVAAAPMLAGCYHATIHTIALGTPTAPNPESQWAHSWLWGLVPPEATDGAEECPHGVARVETEMTFVNGLVNVLTGGIDSPITVTVTCRTAEANDAR